MYAIIEKLRRLIRCRAVAQTAATPQNASVYFHEDDYCQIELLPRAAWKHCQYELGEIADFADAHRDGDNYTDIYLREETPSLRPLRIGRDTVDQILRGSLQRFDRVTTGYSSHVEDMRKTLAYCAGRSCVVFVEHDDEGIVAGCWFRLQPDRQASAGIVEEMLSLLTALAKDHDLILVDWQGGSLLALRDRNRLRDYLATQLTSKISAPPETAIH